MGFSKKSEALASWLGPTSAMQVFLAVPGCRPHGSGLYFLKHPRVSAGPTRDTFNHYGVCLCGVAFMLSAAN